MRSEGGGAPKGYPFALLQWPLVGKNGAVSPQFERGHGVEGFCLLRGGKGKRFFFALALWRL